MAQTDEFKDAFNSEDAQPDAQTEDQVFGLEEEPTEESQAMPEDDGEAESGSEGSAGDDAEGEAPAVVIAVTPGAEETAPEEEMPADPKDLQRMKSWEGRLKAREAELKAREEALNKSQVAEPMEPGETRAQESAEPGVTEAIEDAAESVQNGDMTVEQALSGLADTFGEDFTKMLGVLIEQKASEISGKTADDRFGKVKGEIDSLAHEIVADKASSHYESIADAHPDFMDVAASPEFRAYVEGLPADQQQKAAQVIQNGSARQIVKLLSDYKSSIKKVDPPAEDPAMDAAEGVRSKGLKIPEKPSVSEDFAEAWNQF